MVAVFGDILTLDNQSGTIVFICVLVVFSIFDGLLHVFEVECEKRGFKGLIKKLYREFMIMGFISFGILFAEETGNYKGKNKWYIAFHFTHVVIIFVGITFLVKAVIFISLALSRKKTLLHYDNYTSQTLLMEFISLSVDGGVKKIIFDYGPVAIPYPVLRERIEFKILQEYFIRNYNFRPEFRFADYLCRVLVKYVISLVEVRPISWLIIGILVVLNWLRIITIDKQYQSKLCREYPMTTNKYNVDKGEAYLSHVCPEYTLRYILLWCIIFVAYLLSLLIASEVYIQRLINKVLDDELNFKWLEEDEKLTRHLSYSINKGRTDSVVLDRDGASDGTGVGSGGVDIEAGVIVENKHEPLDFIKGRQQGFSKGIKSGVVMMGRKDTSQPITSPAATVAATTAVVADNDNENDDSVVEQLALDEIDGKIKAIADCSTDLNDLLEEDRNKVVLRIADAFKKGWLNNGSQNIQGRQSRSTGPTFLFRQCSDGIVLPRSQYNDGVKLSRSQSERTEQTDGPSSSSSIVKGESDKRQIDTSTAATAATAVSRRNSTIRSQSNNDSSLMRRMSGTYVTAKLDRINSNDDNNNNNNNNNNSNLTTEDAALSKAIMRRLSGTYVTAKLERVNSNNNNTNNSSSNNNNNINYEQYNNNNNSNPTVEEAALSKAIIRRLSGANFTTHLGGENSNNNNNNNTPNVADAALSTVDSNKNNHNNNNKNTSWLILKHSDNQRFLYFHCLYRMMQMESIFYADEARHLKSSESSAPSSPQTSTAASTAATASNPLLRSRSIRFLMRPRGTSTAVVKDAAAVAHDDDDDDEVMSNTGVMSNYQAMKLITKERKEREKEKAREEGHNFPEVEGEDRGDIGGRGGRDRFFPLNIERKNAIESRKSSSSSSSSINNSVGGSHRIYDSIVGLCSCLYSIPGKIMTALMGHHSGLHSLSQLSTNDTDTLKLHTELSEIFLFRCPELYFYAIELALLMQCLYIALWATNFLFIANISYHLILWNIALLIPLPINIFILQQIIFTSCMLKSIVYLDKDVAADVYESTEKERDLKYKLRKLLRNSLKIMHPDDDADNWSKHTEIAFKNHSHHSKFGLVKADFISFLHFLQIILNDESVDLIYKALDADKDKVIHWDQFKAIIFPELHNSTGTADVKVNRQIINNNNNNNFDSRNSSSTDLRQDQQSNSNSSSNNWTLKRSTTNPNLEYHIAQTICMDRKNDSKSANELNLLGDDSGGIYNTRSSSSPALLLSTTNNNNNTSTRRGNIHNKSIVTSYNQVESKVGIDDNNTAVGGGGSKGEHNRAQSLVAENKRGNLSKVDRSLKMDTIYREISADSEKSVAASDGGKKQSKSTVVERR